MIPDNHGEARDRLCILARVDGEDHVLAAPGIRSSSGNVF